MKIIARWTFLLLVGFAACLSAYGVYVYRREVTQFEGDTHNDLRLVGLTLRTRLIDLLRSGHAERIEKAVKELDQVLPDTSVSWVWLSRGAGAASAVSLSPSERSALNEGQEILHGDAHSAAPGQTVLFMPVVAVPDPPGVLVVARNNREKVRYTRHTLLAILVATGVVLGLSIVLAFLLSSHLVGTPIARIIEQFRRMGEGDLSPVTVDRSDEIGLLGHAANRLCARLADNQTQIRRQTDARIAAVEQARHADRLATVGRLASGLAHELGTPLNVVGGLATAIARGEYEPDEIPATAETIAAQARRMTRIVQDILHFVRRHRSSSTEVDVRAVTASAVELLAPLARKASVTVELAAGEPCIAEGDGEHLTQVVVNLVQNAVQAQPHGGAVRVLLDEPTAKNPSDPNAGTLRWVRLTVADDGVGMPPEVLEKIFDPFFTTREVGEGTGLGLSVVLGIVQDHGGWVHAESEVGRGSRFLVYIPAPQR